MLPVLSGLSEKNQKVITVKREWYYLERQQAAVWSSSRIGDLFVSDTGKTSILIRIICSLCER